LGAELRRRTTLLRRSPRGSAGGPARALRGSARQHFTVRVRAACTRGCMCMCKAKIDVRVCAHANICVHVCMCSYRRLLLVLDTHACTCARVSMCLCALMRTCKTMCMCACALTAISSSFSTLCTPQRKAVAAQCRFQNSRKSVDHSAMLRRARRHSNPHPPSVTWSSSESLLSALSYCTGLLMWQCRF
jgi:hypothetical protein